ncbi:MAG: Vacuolar fusion protein mon1 [Sclerophora amabilis]|nr:MAG: Vacuolar fusion protein mon1 [Sclerophora amabilis]
MSSKEADPNSASAVNDGTDTPATEESGTPPPPLPPRPKVGSSSNGAKAPLVSLRRGKAGSRPELRTQATTAVSLTDIHTQTHYESPRENLAVSNARSRAGSTSGRSTLGRGAVDRHHSRNGSETEDTGSVFSYAPTLEAAGDVESLMGEALSTGQRSPAWKHSSGHQEERDLFDIVCDEDKDLSVSFDQEFNELGEVDADGDNEEALLQKWRSRLKHFLILSSAGKPIYTRHGDENLISGYIGVIQTIISFYKGSDDPLKAFTAGGTRFVILAEGPLYLVAISRLGESDSQLRAQLDALYMQILSTLTLPTLLHMFSNRPSTDLRRPLQGTEPLLSALADGFTKGSPSTLLSALECLKLRKSYRHGVNNTFLKVRSPNLLYGLIVAGGRLVSVVRPKKHSLHPSDLQLIFNMLFEAEGVKAGGGESWIPLCLPGFNKKGYLYMYVSFLNADDALKQDGPNNDNNNNDDDDDVHNRDTSTAPTPARPSNNSSPDDQIAIVLISGDKESFYELRQMRDDLVSALRFNQSLARIQTAVHAGRPTPTDLVPGTVIRHFLYKSRANVQFTMPTFAPHFATALSHRKLLSVYHGLHAAVHAKTSHLKVHHVVGAAHVALAWVTPAFELFCVAGPSASRNAVAQGANRIIQSVKREEERVFILGGAVF